MDSVQQPILIDLTQDEDELDTIADSSQEPILIDLTQEEDLTDTIAESSQEPIVIDLTQDDDLIQHDDSAMDTNESPKCPICYSGY